MNALFTDNEHRYIFKDTILFKDTLVPDKFANQRVNTLKWTLSNVMAGDAVKCVHSSLLGRHLGILITLDLLGCPLVFVITTRI